MDKLKSKIRGCFLGAAIGDALGLPVEMCKPEFITEKYGRITDYVENKEHKYFTNAGKGVTSDDWQLTKAIARSIVNKKDIDLEDIAQEHVKEYAISVRGWGGSTREAVARLAEGVSYLESGKAEVDNRGLGNGICMKVSPLGLFLAIKNPNLEKDSYLDFMQKIARLSMMTHYTSIAISSGICQVFSIYSLFHDAFDAENFKQMLDKCVNSGNSVLPETIKDDLNFRFQQLRNDLTNEEIQEFGGGSCYVYDSLPFSYAYFLRNPYSIETLYDCISAGGDADTNGSIVGSLLGTLNGEEIFPEHLKRGLKNYDEVIQLADEFYFALTN